MMYTNMYIRITFLINVESKSQITNIPLRRLDLIACMIGPVYFPNDKENVIISET